MPTDFTFICSTSLESYFFCGNDLLEHSIKEADSACAPCVNRSNRSCGAPEALSIYKLRGELTIVVSFIHSSLYSLTVLSP